tara:strand:- start:14213 stop:14419 length:207 start_codon:yes stop_codon:yes gene_type:complete
MINTITVVSIGERDADSTKLLIKQYGVEIGHGHINNRTNFAHITLNNQDDDLHNRVALAIERGSITID